MDIDLPYILVLLVLGSGLICLVDILFFAKARRQTQAAPAKLPIVVDYSRSFFPLLLLVLLIRSFVFQPYRVPTGSLEPTVVPGDLIAVNMFQYGLRLPLSNRKILNIHEPKRGDIMLFRWPVNPKLSFVKRVIGIPGDHISYIDKVLYINGKKMKQTFIADALESDGNSLLNWPVKVIEENLDGVKHQIYINPAKPAENFYNLVIPAGKYLMIGDNRDNSDDSRYWGFVQNSDIIGKAFAVWFNWNSETYRPRWDRIGILL